MSKWLSAPALIVQRSTLTWVNSPSDTYVANAEAWTDGEVDALIADLTFGLQTISAGAFQEFSSIRIDQTAAGDSVVARQAGAIVVARYLALRGPSGDIVGGLGTPDIDSSGVIRGATLKINRDTDARGGSGLRALRVHELGHTTRRCSFEDRASVIQCRRDAHRPRSRHSIRDCPPPTRCRR